jgi:heptosyltransferase-3
MTSSTISSPRRILIIRLQHHGDVLLTTPMFSALRRRFPGVEVDALVYAETAPMLAANPEVTRLWTLPRRGQAGRGLRRLAGFARLLRDIRRLRYDWVLHLNDQWPGAAVAAASGARLRYGYAMPKRDNWVWRAVFNRRAPEDHSSHMVETNLKVLAALGIEVDPRDATCTIAFDARDADQVHRELVAAGVNGGYVLVHPTARWFFKCWEDERFAEVIGSLVRAGRRVVLTAGPDRRELDLIDALLARVADPRVVSLAGRLTLPQLAAAIAGADLFVGVDSVPMHMAAALDRPIVALFGPTLVQRWRPWSQHAEVINAADYGPLIAPNAVDTSTDERHLKNIPVQPVLDAVWRQLSLSDQTLSAPTWRPPEFPSSSRPTTAPMR